MSRCESWQWQRDSTAPMTTYQGDYLTVSQTTPMLVQMTMKNHYHNHQPQIFPLLTAQQHTVLQPPTIWHPDFVPAKGSQLKQPCTFTPKKLHLTLGKSYLMVSTDWKQFQTILMLLMNSVHWNRRFSSKGYLVKLFPFRDWWYRFEWQSRGTLHVHCHSWHVGAPDPITCTPQKVTFCAN